MSHLKKHLGMALIVIGAIILAISYPTRLSNFNAVLNTGLLFIVGGAILHVRQQKQHEKY